MKQKYITLFLIIMVFSNSGGMLAQSVWKKFSPPDQPFEVMTPVVMKNGEKKILTDLGQLFSTTWMCQGEGDDPNFIYSLSYVDYPAGTFHADSTALIDDFFNISVDTNIKNLGGTLVYKSDLPYGPHPGVIYRASYNNNGAVIKSRMMLIGDRFYALQVFTLSEKSLNPEMDRFLNSFKTGQTSLH
ncbi:MAG: hypothetical protein H7X99_02395 [Saprospiraceae bacterium]|nr:hypothetical protein [Saprospiraceae bacterium]